jgi:hypothetical protein
MVHRPSRGSAGWTQSSGVTRTAPGQFGEKLRAAVAEFGSTVAPRLRLGVGDREDQVRGPLERLLHQVGTALGVKVVTHGETRLLALAVRPDYAVDVAGARVGYVEIKAPGKGADPTKWSAKSHDGRQWDKLKALPNVLYTDGQEWALFRTGQRVGKIVRLEGDLEQAGRRLRPADDGLARILTEFLWWEPETPRNIRGLVRAVAGLCRLLRDEVRDVLERERAGDDVTFSSLAEDWRGLMFPDLDDARFADAYAQTVTFALLLARINGIAFDNRDLPDIARQLGKQHTLIGKALAILTEDTAEKESVVLQTLQRVIGVVDWDQLNDESTDSYAILYEAFLEEYDPTLRRQSGSYYTPRPVAKFMVHLVDQILKTRVGVEWGFADDEVLVVDPVMGTGTFLVEIIHRVASTMQDEAGSPKTGLRGLFERRLIGFEKQVCPYSVAELKTHQALKSYKVDIPEKDVRFLTDALDNPDHQELHFGTLYKIFQEARKEASWIKRKEPVMVVIGNPPYRERARGLANWIEGRRDPKRPQGLLYRPSLDEFRASGRGRYEYVLSNLYVYFWRWATWKVFDAHPGDPAGVVAFITTSAYLFGPGFAGMREYLRRTADEGWIVDLSPEGHQPPINTRVFPGVQHPLCIAIFVRYGDPQPTIPANIHYITVDGLQHDKFHRLDELQLDDPLWVDCFTEWQEPIAPAKSDEWSSYPPLGDLMPWHLPGVKPNRTWVYAPDQTTLQRRWERITRAPEQEKSVLFKESNSANLSRIALPLAGHPALSYPFREERGACPVPEMVSYRSFDRQFIIPDARLLDRPRRDLWNVRSNKGNQLYVTEQHGYPVQIGPGVTFAAYVPDMDHFMGHHGGRVLPLYRDATGLAPNFARNLRRHLGGVLYRESREVAAEDLIAYIAAITAHAGYTARFQRELESPGVRVPLTSDLRLWHTAVRLGQEVLWLQTYGECFEDRGAGRPRKPKRLLTDERPMVRQSIPLTPEEMPDEISYDPETRTLHVGKGTISPVLPGVWDYQVGGTNVVKKWFGYRKRNPTGRRSSPLDDINASRWEDETTIQLLQLLDVLTRLVQLEPQQEVLLDEVCNGPLVAVKDLERANVFPVPNMDRRPPLRPRPGQQAIQ